MVLCPLDPGQPAFSHMSPAWTAVAETQRRPASSWWMVAQPDHADLAGELAANFSAAEFPALDDEVVRAIALHDAGWTKYDGGTGREAGLPEPLHDGCGRPLSFLDVSPSIFVEAWTASIRCAEEKTGPMGGLMVSGHFCRLAQRRMASISDAPQDASLLHSFVETESGRQEQWLAAQPRSREDVERLTDVLQFCDLLSLYLCCGSRQEVEFPQTIGPHGIVLRRQGELCVLEPSPFQRQLSLGVAARRYPASSTKPNTAILPVLVS